jgi:hypothetical protein
MKYISYLMFAVSIVAVFIFGCAMGASKEKIIKTAIGSVEERAGFDMECEEINSKLLGDMKTEMGVMEMNIGVSGCDRKATYYTKCLPTYNSIGAPTGEVACTPILNNITNNININIIDEHNKSDE